MKGPTLFSVPRRFDLTTLLVVVAACAVLLTAMRMLSSPPRDYFMVTGIFFSVALGQLFGPRLYPRTASAVAGALFCTVLGFFYPVDEFVSQTLNESIIGGILGYFVGVTIAAVFLIAHHCRVRLASANGEASTVTALDKSLWGDKT